MTLVFQGSNFQVEVVRREIRGMSQDFEVVRRPRIVICVPVAHDGRLVLIRQTRVPVEKSVIEFPAGRLEEGETAIDGITRELAEEAGFEVAEVAEIGVVQTAPHFCDEQIRVFVAKGRITMPRTPSPKEAIDRTFVIDPYEIRLMISRGEINDCKTIAAFFLACETDVQDEAVS